MGSLTVAPGKDVNGNSFASWLSNTFVNGKVACMEDGCGVGRFSLITECCWLKRRGTAAASPHREARVLAAFGALRSMDLHTVG